MAGGVSFSKMTEQPEFGVEVLQANEALAFFVEVFVSKRPEAVDVRLVEDPLFVGVEALSAGVAQESPEDSLFGPLGRGLLCLLQHACAHVQAPSVSRRANHCMR